MAAGDADLLALSWRVRKSASTESPKLWINDGFGTFTDTTLAAGLEDIGNNIHGATIADIDGDGDIGEVLAGGGGGRRGGRRRGRTNERRSGHMKCFQRNSHPI